MLDLIFQNLEKIVSLQLFGLLFVLFVFCNLGFWWRSSALNNIKTFDGRRSGYTPEDAKQLLDDLGERGRKIYALTQVSLDLIFPFVYGGMFVILLSWLGLPRYFLLLPIFIVIFDLLENALTTYMALSYKTDLPPPSQLVRLASAFTVTKWIGVYLFLLILLFGISSYVWRKK